MAQFDPKGTLGTGSAGLAVGGAYLAVAAGIDHPVAELGVARQDAPVDRAGGGGELARIRRVRAKNRQDVRHPGGGMLANFRDAADGDARRRAAGAHWLALALAS